MHVPWASGVRRRLGAAALALPEAAGGRRARKSTRRRAGQAPSAAGLSAHGRCRQPGSRQRRRSCSETAFPRQAGLRFILLRGPASGAVRAAPPRPPRAGSPGVRPDDTEDGGGTCPSRLRPPARPLPSTPTPQHVLEHKPPRGSSSPPGLRPRRAPSPRPLIREFSAQVFNAPALPRPG